ncbi:MAG: hypothetical protein QM500_19435, partial [Methylococcales bacterium]
FMFKYFAGFSLFIIIIAGCDNKVNEVDQVKEVDEVVLNLSKAQIKLCKSYKSMMSSGQNQKVFFLLKDMDASQKRECLNIKQF